MGTFKEELHLLIFCLTYFLSTARYRLQNDNNTECTLCSLQRTYPLLVLGTQNKIRALTPNSFFLNQIKHKYRSANLSHSPIWIYVRDQFGLLSTHNTDLLVMLWWFFRCGFSTVLASALLSAATVLLPKRLIWKCSSQTETDK